MKKQIKSFIAILLATLLFNVQMFAYGMPLQTSTSEVNQSVYVDESSEILAQVSELDALAEFTNSNGNASYDEVASVSPELVSNVSNNASSGSNSEPPLGIPSFVWGCLFGLIGMILVYVATDNDKAEVKKALNGCLVSALLSGVFYAIGIASAASTGTTSGY